MSRLQHIGLVLKEFRPGLWLTEASLDDFEVRGAVIIGAERAVIWDSLSHLHCGLHS